MTEVNRGSVTAIAVSPLDSQILWAGTDDGNIWVTDDAGSSWSQVGPTELTQWVTRIACDPFDARTAYVTLSGYREGAYLPHLLRIAGLGSDWADITGDLPERR